MALLGSTSQLPMAILALLHLHCRILQLNRSLISQMQIFSYEPRAGEYCQCWQYSSFFFMKTEPTINEKNPPLLLLSIFTSNHHQFSWHLYLQKLIFNKLSYSTCERIDLAISSIIISSVSSHKLISALMQLETASC